MEERRFTRAANALLPGRGFDAAALLAPEQALTLFFARADLQPPRAERVAIEAARGRVLAERMYADADYPSDARSTMDGFAIRAAQTPGRFRVGGEVRMGHAWSGAWPEGNALRIPTGGMLPPGADAVVPIEDAYLEGELVEIREAVAPGDCVNPRGADMRQGEPLLEPGRRLGGAELGLLATLGVTKVPVYRRPVFGVISSGDELVAASTAPGPAQIRDSNRWALGATLEALGALVTHFPIAPDEPAALEALLRESLNACDGLILSGGSSVGERDLTPRVVAGLGRPGVIVHGLRVKPGKPTVLACAGGKPVIGLPGNPASSLMILEAVAAPVVDALTGARTVRATVDAVLDEPFRKRAGWTWFVPVRLDETAATAVVRMLALHSSSVSLPTRASGYAVLGEAVESLDAGSHIRVTRFLQGGA